MAVTHDWNYQPGRDIPDAPAVNTLQEDAWNRNAELEEALGRIRVALAGGMQAEWKNATDPWMRLQDVECVLRSVER